MGEVVKLDKKAREARKKAAAAREANAGASGSRASAGGRPVVAIIGGLILVLMIVVTFIR